MYIIVEARQIHTHIYMPQKVSQTETNIVTFQEGYSKLKLFLHLKKQEKNIIIMDEIQDVDIDFENGSEEYKAKYVLIKITSQNGDCKTIVRANKMAGYHKDIYNPVSQQISNKYSFKCEVCGGGRIMVMKPANKIKVYGYSVDFGKADHEKTVNMIKEVETFSSWDISFSDDGY